MKVFWGLYWGPLILGNYNFWHWGAEAVAVALTATKVANVLAVANTQLIATYLKVVGGSAASGKAGHISRVILYSPVP